MGKLESTGCACPSAIATYGLRRTAQEAESQVRTYVRHFVERDFYVDDGLNSLPSEHEAVDLLERTQRMLMGSNLRLHKIASNSVNIMKAFPTDDCAADLKDLDLNGADVPMQSSLGLSWHLKTNMFTFRAPAQDSPNTCRGVLSAVNSLYDPLGMTVPVTVQGGLFLRDMSVGTTDWGAPLAVNHSWQRWKDSLQALEDLRIRRRYVTLSLAHASRREICTFSDASEKIIAAVAYTRVIDANETPHVGFVFGKAKLPPRPEQTIPRLELCAAVLAVGIRELILGKIRERHPSVMSGSTLTARSSSDISSMSQDGFTST
ncbi:uncharacterized protein LOC135393826 [Ornithodoros turicata]|uniref:uncharacterized protein LOC135393826 n=1 Tax=Ornithodoros turicata TaxID=34597 RepID=UPI003138ADDB